MALDLTATDKVMSLGRWVVALSAEGNDWEQIAAETGASQAEAMFAVGLYVGRIITGGRAEPRSSDCRLGLDYWCWTHNVFHEEKPAT